MAFDVKVLKIDHISCEHLESNNKKGHTISFHLVH